MSTTQNEGPDPTNVRALYSDPTNFRALYAEPPLPLRRVVPTLMVPRPWHVRLRGWLARRIYPEGCDE